MAAHADAGPSSSKRWITCPASVTLTRGVRTPSSKYALEGSAAHQVGEFILAGQTIPEFVEIDGEQILVSEDMIAHAHAYAALVDAIRYDADWWGVEEKIDLDWLLIPRGVSEKIFGTADFLAYDKKTKTLYVVDFKYGAGVAVSAEDNSQMRIYALGALAKIKHKPVDTIRTVIVQPRASGDTVKFEDIPYEELAEWAEKVLIPAARRIGDGDTSESAGDHCKWCARAGTCAELYATVCSATRDAFAATQIEQLPQASDCSPVQPTDLTDDDLSAIMLKADLIEGWVSAVRAEAIRRMDLGGKIPGFKLVPKRALRKWSDATAVLNRLCHDDYAKLMPDDIYTPQELRSVAQIEKAFKKHGLDFEQFTPFVTRESSGVNLAREEDNRAAVSSSTALLFTKDAE